MKRFIMKLFYFLIVFTVFDCHAQWIPDSLGDGFVKKTITQPDDYSGEVQSTIIRLLNPDNHNKKRRGVLYIHGFNDYFFQKEMAQEFVAHGYDFYAVDLRKYGRSLKENQKPFQVRNLKEYFPDIDSAINVMKQCEVDTIVLIGHSTGGLIATYFLESTQNAAIQALILNSPFFDWNLGKIEWLVPVISSLGKFFPNLKIPQSGSVYSESLDKNQHGEWIYNHNWKKPENDYVDAGWIRAIHLAQSYVKDNPGIIKIPILLMYSSESFYGNEWSPKAQESDAVLDVNDIKRIGLRLGPDVQPLKVKGGMHDLILSRPGVRYSVYTYIFNWLQRIS